MSFVTSSLLLASLLLSVAPSAQADVGPAAASDCAPARTLWEEGEERAEARARTCQEAAPEDPQRMLALSQILGWQDRHEEALAWADAALERAPADLDLIAWRLRLLGWLGRYDEADAALALVEGEETHGELALVRADLARWRETPRSGFTLRLMAGPILSSGVGSGWRGRIGVEAPASERLQLRGGFELQQRSYGGEDLRDPLVDAGATWQLSERLSLDAGVGFSIAPSFSPEWNAHLEAGIGLGAGFTAYARYWRIEFPTAGVDVLSPALGYQGSSFWALARLWRSFDPSGDGLAVLIQGGVPLIWDLDLSLGIGGGDKADYLILRDVAVGVERHLVGLAGLSWSPSYEYQLRADYIGRREWSGDDSLIRHELLFGVARRW